MFGPVAVANGQGDPGFFDGIQSSGHRVRIVSPVCSGTDPEGATTLGEIDAGTQYHRDGVRINSSATDHVVDNPSCFNQTGQSVRTEMGSGVCIVHQKGTGGPFSAGAWGSVGSTYVDENSITTVGNVQNTVWVKTWGNPNVPHEGWQPISDLGYDSRPQDGSAAVSRFVSTLELNSASGSKEITTTGLGVPSGRRVRIVITTYSGGEYTIDVVRGSTLGTVTMAGIMHGCEIVYDGTNWKLVQLLDGATFG